MSFSHVIWLLKSQTFGLYLGWLLVPFTIYLSSYKLFSTVTPTLRTSQNCSVSYNECEYRIVSYSIAWFYFSYLLINNCVFKSQY